MALEGERMPKGSYHFLILFRMTDLTPLIETSKSDLDKEVNFVKSSYAFKGFGRSTEAAQKAAETAIKAQEVVDAAVNYKAAQDYLDRVAGGDNGDAIKMAFEVLYSTKTVYEKAKNAQKKRIAEQTQDLLGYSQERTQLADAEMRIRKKPKKIFKKAFQLQQASSELKQRKTLDNVKSAGDMASIKGINKLTSLSTLPTLMSLQSLSSI